MDKIIEDLNLILAEKHLTLAIAESCTGGMLCAEITARPGASAIFDRGFITYSNQAKQEQLGVSPEIIANYGAVSGECAAAMATGALKNSQADIAAAITGIAGPTGGSAEKPLGLVYIGIATLSHQAFVEELSFEGGREEIREKATKEALELLLKTARAI